jgi:hypothetical protein
LSRAGWGFWEGQDLTTDRLAGIVTIAFGTLFLGHAPQPPAAPVATATLRARLPTPPYDSDRERDRILVATAGAKPKWKAF